jgi:hypothetical protein
MKLSLKVLTMKPSGQFLQQNFGISSAIIVPCSVEEGAYDLKYQSKKKTAALFVCNGLSFIND